MSLLFCDVSRGCLDAPRLFSNDNYRTLPRSCLAQGRYSSNQISILSTIPISLGEYWSLHWDNNRSILSLRIRNLSQSYSNSEFSKLIAQSRTIPTENTSALKGSQELIWVFLFCKHFMMDGANSMPFPLRMATFWPTWSILNPLMLMVLSINFRLLFQSTRMSVILISPWNSLLSHMQANTDRSSQVIFRSWSSLNEQFLYFLRCLTYLLRSPSTNQTYTLRLFELPQTQSKLLPSQSQIRSNPG